MSRFMRVSILALLVIGVLSAGAYYLSHHTIAVLAPAGQIASQQRHLIVFATLMMLLIVLPVFGLTFYIVWKYRASNTSATYRPDWDHNTKLETIWWVFPCVIILVLAIVTWNSSHALDPYKAIASDQPALNVQVIAMQWKWLFLYPDQGIASINYLQLPVGRPVNFTITSDAPMNSFWIPQLGGQVYAMAGMNTQLHLIATKPGNYAGSSANLSGAGFSAMHFTTKATSEQDFANWAQQAQTPTTAADRLSLGAYSRLTQPSVVATPKVYNSYDNRVYDSVMMKYMAMNQDGTMRGMTHD